jgi:ribosomal protein S18 acetylase RimI-like enzyme
VLIAVEQTEKPGTKPGTAYRVGFAASGPADAAALAPDENHNALGDDVVAVTELMVEPRWGRRGHGSRLLSASVDHWRADGFRTAVAWAFKNDVATVTCLTAAGWAPDGAARALDVDDLLVPQIRLRTLLD